MANEVNVVVSSTEDVSQTLSKVGSSAKATENVIVRTMGSSEDAFDTAARSSGKLGEGLDKLSGAGSQLAGGIGDLSDGMQSLADYQKADARYASEQARKLLDVEQAMEDTQQAAEDLKQAQLDLNQSVLDGKQGQIDFEQAQIDQKQALLDASEAQKAYNSAVKEHGPNSAEAKQAAIDLTQAQADLKQANLDADQALADVAQATADGAQANRDMSQATIDAKTSQLDLNDAQREAKPPTEMENWSRELGLIAPLITGVVGAIDLLILANTALNISTIKSIAVQAAQKTAMIAGAAATGVATAATWAFNAAMLVATSPITLTILAIAALIAIIVLIATKTTWFQDLWNFVWNSAKATTLAAWNAIKLGAQSLWSYMQRVWDYFLSIPGKIGNAFSAVTNFLTAPFRSAFSAIAGLWNRTIGRLSWTIPDWVPGIGGNSISAPKLPTFHTGGNVLRTGAAILQKGERVIPASRAGASGGGMAGVITLVLDMRGAPDDLRRWVQKNTKAYGGNGSNSVQLAWS